MPLRVLELAGAGEIQIAISEPIIAEVVRVLGDKFSWPAERLRKAENVMRGLCEVVTPTLVLDVVPSDPDDNCIVECAVAFGADAIITGDTDLLRLGAYEGVRIVRVRYFLANYKT